MDDDLCPHGDITTECNICLGYCDHGYLEEECEICNWKPGDFSNIERAPREFFDETDPADRHHPDMDELLWLLDHVPALVERAPKPWEVDGLDEEELAARRARRAGLARLLEQILSSHGLPLHWEVLARMVRAKRSDLNISDQEIWRTLSGDKSRFQRVDAGVYFVRRPDG